MRAHHGTHESSNALPTAGPSLALGILMGFGAAAATFPAHGAETAAVVSLTDNFQFEPREVTIRAGDAVEWRNVSHFNHSVTADPKQGDASLPAGAEAFSSGEIRPGGNFQHVLSVPGKYRYFCMPHEGIGMTGQVIVLPR